MTEYFNSGVLVKLYVREANSAHAARLIGRHPFAEITPLHELEIRNTLRALEGSTIITASQRAVSEHMLDRDIVAGRLRQFIPDWSLVFRGALDLSRG